MSQTTAHLTKISPEEARGLLAQGAFLVDIRELEEHKRERVAGAAHAPLSKLDQIELEAAGIAGTPDQAAETAAFRHGLGFVAADDFLFELLVFLGEFFHLRLDGREIVRGDPVFHVEVIVESVVSGRPIGELRVRPEAENGGGHEVGTGVAQPVQIGHLFAFFEGLAVVHREKGSTVRGQKSEFWEEIGKRVGAAAHEGQEAEKGKRGGLPVHRRISEPGFLKVFDGPTA